MLYEMLRLPLMLLFLAFYRRIHFSRMRNFPKKGGVIVATNHSTACAEQMLIATFQRRGVYFWARASVFPGGFWNWLFRQGHLIPIYRPQEGLKNMAKNKDTFELSQQLLSEGKVLYIAPEGNCVLEKRLREFKTGTARIAFQTAAAADFKEPIYILPTGVNYSHHTRFRSDVMISFGKPIVINDYAERYRSHPAKAIAQLNEDMRRAIRAEMVYIEHKNDEPLVERLLTLYKNDSGAESIFPLFTRNRQRLEMEQGVAETINSMEQTHKTQLQSDVEQYFVTLEQHHLNDLAVCGAYQNGLMRRVELTTFFPLAMLGWLSGWLPMRAARYLRGRWVHDMQFWAPVAVVAAALTWFIYALLWSLMSVIFIGWWGLWMIPASVIGQYTTIFYQAAWQRWQMNARYNQWKRQHLPKAQQLEAVRARLIAQMDTAIANTASTIKAQ